MHHKTFEHALKSLFGMFFLVLAEGRYKKTVFGGNKCLGTHNTGAVSKQQWV